MQFYIETLQKVPVPLLFLFSAIFSVSGDMFAKYWAIDHKWSFFSLAILAYAGSVFFFMPILLKEGLIVTAMIWTIATIIGFTIVGLVLFKESLTITQILGMVVGLISVVLLTYKSS